jgi:hypothetical protein
MELEEIYNALKKTSLDRRKFLYLALYSTATFLSGCSSSSGRYEYKEVDELMADYENHFGEKVEISVMPIAARYIDKKGATHFTSISEHLPEEEFEGDEKGVLTLLVPVGDYYLIAQNTDEKREGNPDQAYKMIADLIERGKKERKLRSIRIGGFLEESLEAFSAQTYGAIFRFSYAVIDGKTIPVGR